MPCSRALSGYSGATCMAGVGAWSRSTESKIDSCAPARPPPPPPPPVPTRTAMPPMPPPALRSPMKSGGPTSEAAEAWACDGKAGAISWATASFADSRGASGCSASGGACASSREASWSGGGWEDSDTRLIDGDSSTTWSGATLLTMYAASANSATLTPSAPSNCRRPRPTRRSRGGPIAWAATAMVSLPSSRPGSGSWRRPAGTGP
jgi:hypothetical protein